MSDGINNIVTNIILKRLAKDDLLNSFKGDRYFHVRNLLTSPIVISTLKSFNISIGREQYIGLRQFLIIQYPNNDYYKIELIPQGDTKSDFTLKFFPYGGK